MIVLASAAHQAAQFWPNIDQLLTLVAAIAANGAAYWGRKNHNINQEVRILLNGELHAKLERLEELTGKLAQVTSERDAAVNAQATQQTQQQTPPPPPV